MSTQNQNREKFSFHLGKLKFDSTQPGKETRKTLALVGLIVILLLLTMALAFYFLKINILSAGIFGTVTTIGGRLFAKGARSP
jgi:hypothetical protein